MGWRSAAFGADEDDAAEDEETRSCKQNVSEFNPSICQLGLREKRCVWMTMRIRNG